MPKSSAINIVNDALIESGMEASFDYKLKCLLILIVDASLKRGYVSGWEDHEEGKPPNITRKQLVDFAKIFKKARGEPNSSHS